MRHDQGTHNPPDPPPIQAPDGRPPTERRPEDADPSRPLFWRRGPRRAAAPPPPIWELPEMPTLWTRLKQQARQRADRWLGDRKRDDQRDVAPNESGQDTRHAAPRTRRREDTASLRPPAETSAETSAEDDDLDISSDVLESAYEAVRQGRISDPATIRQLADHFIQLTEDDESGSGLGFEPREAARRLRQRAAEIAQRRGLHDDEDPSPTQNGEGSGSRHPHRTTPQVERDENITRGG